jgi:membrane-bound metal-dependent hydrolase YbcI (DUF457 family)
VNSNVSPHSFTVPITPFHFGPGAALHAVAPRHVSFLAFCAANVLIDVESLYNLVNQRHPVHAFFHTYVGASLVIIAVGSLFVAARWFAGRFWLPNLLRWRNLSLRQVIVGAALGAYSHVVLDSVMHSDIQPLAPFSSANALLGALPLSILHIACVVLGLLGVLGVILRRLMAEERNAG